MSNNLFQKNSEKWAETNPQKALLLPFLNLKKSDVPKETDKQAEKWFSTLDLKETSVLFVYGIGQGHYYKAAKNWLKGKDHRLIFLEDDLDIIYRLLSTKLGEELLHDKSVSLYYFEGVEEARETMLSLRWEFLTKKIEVSCLDFYGKTKNEKYQHLRHRILNDQSLHNSLVKEYLDFGAAFFFNFYRNLKLLPGSFLGSSLYGKFKNVPAIICGAGPSLEQHFSTLKNMQNKALIFAGGSSLNALIANDITPHFGAGIDPNSAQKLRISQTCHVKLPFFFRSRMHHEALKLIKGKRLYIPGCGGYDISEWFEDELKINRDRILDEGHNVINFEVEIAHALGCHPIIFVGMDLGYTGMRSYAKGIVYDATVSKKDILKSNHERNADDFDLKAILKKDIFGKPIYTLWKWIIESEWMGEFAKEHPDILLINATEGGLGFPGIKNQSLKSLGEKYLNKNFQFEKRIETHLQKGTMKQVTSKKINRLVQELKSSLMRCVSNLNILLEEIDRISQKIKLLKKLEPGFNILSGRAALFESDLFEEIGFKYVLEVFSEAYAGVLNHEIRLVRTGKMSEKKKALKKLELNGKRLAFLKTVAEVNLELIRMAGFDTSNKDSEEGYVGHIF
jgi:hypothetical protein